MPRDVHDADQYLRDRNGAHEEWPVVSDERLKSIADWGSFAAMT
jgi:hypothetical protein